MDNANGNDQMPNEQIYIYWFDCCAAGKFKKDRHQMKDVLIQATNDADAHKQACAQIANDYRQWNAGKEPHEVTCYRISKTFV